MLLAAQIDTKNCLTTEQIKEMMADGWEMAAEDIGGKRYLSRSIQTGEEIGKSKPLLEQNLVLKFRYSPILTVFR